MLLEQLRCLCAAETLAGWNVEGLRQRDLPIRLVAAGFPGMPWLSTPHHGLVEHPLVSLLVVAVILALVARIFLRKPD